jgi:hypothetical protein
MDVSGEILLDGNQLHAGTLTLMFTPHTITWCKIMNASQELKVIKRNLVWLNAKFMLELALSGCSCAFFFQTVSNTDQLFTFSTH